MKYSQATRLSFRLLSVAAYLLFITGVAGPLWAGPAISIDTTEVIVDVPIGTVSSNALEIFNVGDATLNWTLTDRFTGKVVKSFPNPWTSARSMRYDATRGCRKRRMRRRIRVA